MVRRTIALAILATLALGSGCAKPDWIQQTLVTVDVTGVWVGGTTRPSFYGPTEIRLELEQQGSKVTGYFRALPPYPPFGLVNGPLEGTVAGDALTFKLTNGVLAGEASVNGDEMDISITASHRIQASLRRESTPPRSQ